MKKTTRILILLCFWVFVVWGILSWYVQRDGREKITTFGDEMASKHALVVYDPDPFYNLDEQVCHSFAEGLGSKDWQVKVSTVAAAQEVEGAFDLYVFCANTYNFTPDKSISDYIENHSCLTNKPVVAITLGSGATKLAQQMLSEHLERKEATIIFSKTYWLQRPNDEQKMDESNVKVAVEMAFELGRETGRYFKQSDPRISSKHY